MVRNEKPECDPERVDRFQDGELSIAETRRVREHLNHCPLCRQRVEDHRVLTDAIRQMVDTAASQIDFNASEDAIMHRIRVRRLKKSSRFIRFLFSKPFYIPASAIAAAVAAFVMMHHPSAPEPVPSALVDSFTGSISSAMVIHTPKTHHTILWFSEDPSASGEEHAAHHS